MAQTPALRWSEGDELDYTPGSAVTGGDVVLLGSIPFVAEHDIAANALGSLTGEGVFKVPKATGAFTAGDAVYWNTTGNPVTGTAGTGAATSSASGNYLMGVAVLSALSGDSYVYVLLTAAMRTTTIAGSVTADDITGSDSSLGITGQAAAQGGAVAIQGGTSSTGGNNGGAVTVTGGTAGATAVGGAVTLAAGAGGATSGNGGVASMTGGAGTNGNATGGISKVVGGAGQGSAAGGAAQITGGAGGASNGAGGKITATGGAAGATNANGGDAELIGGLGAGSGNGGAITITSGAAGATGVAGAVNISVGGATSGNGSALTLTGGNGAGGTNAGGDINLVPGAAVSTGTPGEVKVNSAAGIFEVNWQQYLAASVPVSGTSYTMFLANRAYRVRGVRVVCSSAGTTPTVDITKDTGTTAPGGGTSVLTGAISFSGTANTVVAGTLTGTVATLTLAAGDRLAHKWGGTVGSITGAIVSVMLSPC